MTVPSVVVAAGTAATEAAVVAAAEVVAAAAVACSAENYNWKTLFCVEQYLMFSTKFCKKLAETDCWDVANIQYVGIILWKFANMLLAGQSSKEYILRTIYTPS